MNFVWNARIPAKGFPTLINLSKLKANMVMGREQN